MVDKHKKEYDFELNSPKSLVRVLSFIENLYTEMYLLNQDSEEASDGGSNVVYRLTINVEEKWI